MAKKYVTRCIVKRNGNVYKKGSVIEGLTEKEIKQGLSQSWLTAVGHDENERDKLLAKAEAAGITVNDAMTDEEINKKIGEAYKRKNLLDKATKLGISVKEEMTDEEIQKLIKDAKAK